MPVFYFVAFSNPGFDRWLHPLTFLETPSFFKKDMIPQAQSVLCPIREGRICSLWKKHSSGVEDHWKNKLEQSQIRGWRGVSAAVCRAEARAKRSVCSQTPVWLVRWLVPLSHLSAATCSRQSIVLLLRAHPRHSARTGGRLAIAPGPKPSGRSRAVRAKSAGHREF